MSNGSSVRICTDISYSHGMGLLVGYLVANFGVSTSSLYGLRPSTAVTPARVHSTYRKGSQANYGMHTIRSLSIT